MSKSMTTSKAGPVFQRAACVLLAFLSLAGSGLAHGPGKENDFGGRRVLLIGIDGCRPDALRKAVESGRAPHFADLIAKGTVTWNAYAGGEPGAAMSQRTDSGPGWTTILTGVWREAHGVTDNRFRFHRIAKNPHVFRKIRDGFPTAWLASFCDWPEIHHHIVGASERPGQPCLDFHETLVPDRARRGTDYAELDARLTVSAVEKIRRENPDALFMYVGNVDETGHGMADKNGRFSADNEPYLAAIARADAQVGELLAAVRGRPRFAEEDWLVLATTDHGGNGKTHGEQSAEERTIWMLASGGRAPRGKVEDAPTPQTAVAPTVLRHLGLPVPADWTKPFALPVK